MERLTIQGFDYDSDFVASNLQSWPIAQALKKLQAYEDMGLEPKEIPSGLDLANVFAALQQLKRFEAIGTVKQCEELRKELNIAKTSICQLCKTRSVEQKIICGCATCKYGGNQNAKL